MKKILSDSRMAKNEAELAKMMVKGTLAYIELAMEYFPNASSPVLARRSFTRLVQRTPGLDDALEATGFHHGFRVLTPRQVRIIFDYLDAPLHLTRDDDED